MFIYVAGARAEAPRAKAAMSALSSMGAKVQEDWTSDQRTDEKAWDDEDAGLIVNRQLQALNQADCLWLLSPEHSVSRGCWVELGYFYGSSKPIVTSGPFQQTIFTSLAHHRFEYDAQALAHFAGLLKEKNNESTENRLSVVASAGIR